MLCRIVCVAIALAVPSAAMSCDAGDLERGLPITDVAITGMGDGNIYLSGAITNNLDFTIGDFAVTTTVIADGRDAPLARQDRPARGLIPGGLMPGETMRSEDWVHVEERGV